MKLINEIALTITICILTRVGVESQFNLNPQYYNEENSGRSRTLYPTKNKGRHTAPTENYQFGPNLPPEQRQREINTNINRNVNVNNDRRQLNNNVNLANNGQIVYETNFKQSPAYNPNTRQDYQATPKNQAALPLSIPATTPIRQGQNNLEEKIMIDNQHRTEANQPSGSEQNNITISISNFGLNLLKTATKFQTGNIVVSPTSIATVLALLQQGTRGESQDQISRLLQMSPDFSARAFGAIASNIMKRNFRNYLSIANNVVVSNKFDLNRDFKTLAAQRFLSEITPANFENPSEAIYWINDWVARKTNHKIVDLLSPEAASRDTQLMIVNTVYFKGIWETMFKPDKTKLESFHLPNSAKKMVNFMHLQHPFQFGNDPGNNALIAILPFESNQYSLMLILPHKTDNVNNLLSTLTADHLMYYHTFVSHEIKMELPKFTIQTDTDLNPVLQSLQVTNIFGGNADLSGIGLFRMRSPLISTAAHSAFFSVDEQGATAAAATSIAAIALSNDEGANTFRVDRPFIAILWDKQFSIPLFIAKVEDPL